ncbi:tRNA lysidine(34) synthetase TilS [Andreprevotia chitinilytica]|uniref:tRNA lysidine(34) synthetase TilS n=1 Tax=Andreprevotia chitinilytica TaxID=396808 RepID=UPI000552D0AD|nr:tRNA lysidine(34) synthetase TilS [Andreprevotia chitinilytica]
MASSRKSQSTDVLSLAVEACLDRHLSASRQRLCIGYSGGLDSTVLLHLAAGLRDRRGFVLSAVHVHHGLSANADAWAAACQTFAAALNVPLRVERVSVGSRRELGLEAAAREARYSAFSAAEADFILLAHHQRDQAETVLFNALRGSGIAGLAGMPAVRDLGAMTLLRPLLPFPREALEAYAQAHALTWCEDESNADSTFRRNFLRNRALPLLREIFPSAETALVRVGRHAEEADSLLGELAREDLASCVIDGAFDLTLTGRLSLLRQRNALRVWLKDGGIVLDSRAFDEWFAQLDAPEDAQPVLVWRERAIRRYRNRFYLTPAKLLAGAPTRLDGRQEGAVAGWQGSLAWQRAAIGIDEKWFAHQLELRPRSGGEKLHLHQGGPGKQLKSLYQEYAVAPWLRDAMPLLYIDDRLAAVPGIGVDAKFAAENGWQPVWQLPT